MINHELITPATAKHYLEAAARNRPVSAAHVRQLVADMQTGRWVDASNPITFDERGYLTNGQHRLRAILLSGKAQRVRVERVTVEVTLFKPSGKYYTTERWRIPADAIGPYDMGRSLDFRRVAGGPVLVDSQEPWGFPHLFPGVQS